MANYLCSTRTLFLSHSFWLHALCLLAMLVALVSPAKLPKCPIIGRTLFCPPYHALSLTCISTTPFTPYIITISLVHHQTLQWDSSAVSLHRSHLAAYRPYPVGPGKINKLLAIHGRQT